MDDPAHPTNATDFTGWIATSESGTVLHFSTYHGWTVQHVMGTEKKPDPARVAGGVAAIPSADVVTAKEQSGSDPESVIQRLRRLAVEPNITVETMRQALTETAAWFREHNDGLRDRLAESERALWLYKGGAFQDAVERADRAEAALAESERAHFRRGMTRAACKAREWQRYGGGGGSHAAAGGGPKSTGEQIAEAIEREITEKERG